MNKVSVEPSNPLAPSSVEATAISVESKRCICPTTCVGRANRYCKATCNKWTVANILITMLAFITISAFFIAIVMLIMSSVYDPIYPNGCDAKATVLWISQDASKTTKNTYTVNLNITDFVSPIVVTPSYSYYPCNGTQLPLVTRVNNTFYLSAYDHECNITTFPYYLQVSSHICIHKISVSGTYDVINVDALVEPQKIADFYQNMFYIFGAIFMSMLILILGLMMVIMDCVR